MGLSFIRNGIFLAIIAHGLIGASLVWDKVLLRRPETRNLVSYVFWLGFISVFGLFLIPFGFQVPSLTVIILAFAAGLLHLVANFFYYAALKADAVILAVSHDVYKQGGWPLVAGRLKPGGGLVMDIKAFLDRASAPPNVRVWRM